jgi:hypothetical protein
VDRRLAKDVAKHIDRRRMRRKIFLWALAITAIVLAVLYLQCGRGWGLGGGKGKGAGPGSGPGSAQPLLTTTADAGPRRCAVRIAAGGITLDGKPATVEEIVAACRSAEDTEVLVTGGARQSDWEALKAALDRAGIRYRESKRSGAGSGT